MARTRRALRYRGTRRGGSRDVNNATRKVYVGGQKKPTTAAKKPTTAAAKKPTTAAKKPTTTAAAKKPTTTAAKKPTTTAAAKKPTTAASTKPATPAANPPTMYFIPNAGKTAALNTVTASFGALVKAINQVYPAPKQAPKALVASNLVNTRLVDVTFNKKTVKAVAVDITGLPATVTDKTIQSATIFGKIPATDNIRKTYSAPAPAQITVAAPPKPGTPPPKPGTPPPKPGTPPPKPGTPPPKPGTPPPPTTQPIPLQPTGDVIAMPGQPIRLQPGDYKGMLSAGKYVIYRDAKRKQQAANVMIQMNPQGDYGLFRVVGTPEQIEKGITELRGKQSTTGLQGLIDAIQREIDDNNRRIQSLRAVVTDLTENIADSQLTGQGLATAQQTIQDSNKEIRDTEEDIRAAVVRLQSAKQALTQERAKAGLPLLSQ